MRHYTTHLIAFALAVLASVSLPAAASSSFESFDAVAFDAAAKSSKVVILDYYAPWCPVCRRQHETLRDLLTSPKYAQITAFRVSFDDDEAMRARYQVKDRATLVMFRGGVEIARVQNVFKRADLESFLARASAK